MLSRIELTCCYLEKLLLRELIRSKERSCVLFLFFCEFFCSLYCILYLSIPPKICVTYKINIQFLACTFVELYKIIIFEYGKNKNH